IANTTEHFPPASHSLRGWLLPACSECNSMAGTEFPEDFESRANLVNQKIRRKYRKEIASIDWHDDEIKSMGRGMQRGLKEWKEAVRIAKQRAAWNAVDYLRLIDQAESFAQIHVDKAGTTRRERLKWRSIVEKNFVVNFNGSAVRLSDLCNDYNVDFGKALTKALNGDDWMSLFHKEG